MDLDSALRAALVAVLSGRREQAAEDITALVAGRVERLGADPEAARWIRTSARTNVELLLQVMAQPDDLARVEPPLGGVALVRRVARRDVPFYELVRGYQLAEWYWVQLCLRELAGLTADREELVAATVEVSALVRAYIDRVCQGLSGEYEAERERWRRRAESARGAMVAALLAGTPVDPAEAEAVLGHRLNRAHRAAVVWSSRSGAEDHAPGLRRAAADLAERLGCPSRPLVVARDHDTLWVWLPDPPGGDPDPGHLAAAHPHVQVALGETATGVDGFVGSHRQAAAAHGVGLVAGAGGEPVFPYREVSSLAFLCADLPRARTWVAETLGGLAAPGVRTAELRRTVRVHRAAHCSATATARLLNCHKNTVQYRIRTAEGLLGHPVERAGPGLDLALLADRWLGDAVSPRPGPLSPAQRPAGG